MNSAQRVEDVLMDKMAKEGSRKGVTRFGRTADMLKHPPTWAAIAGGLAMTGPRGRHAAARGTVSYVVASLVHLPLKAFVGRKHPPGASAVARIGPVTSSFPSGHMASELAFSIGAAQELPLLILPLYGATVASEWSLIRSRSHYPSDVFAGGLLALGVAAAVWKLWSGQRGGLSRRMSRHRPHTGTPTRPSRSRADPKPIPRPAIRATEVAQDARS